MKIKYEEKEFYGTARLMIQRANQVIEKFQAMGYDLTLRQIYYQFVAHDLFIQKYSWTGKKWVKDPDGTINAEPNYKMLGDVISNGRRAGLIDWLAVVDRTRFLRRPSTWESPSEIVKSCVASFKIDLWENQNNYVEVWFEKDALLGVFERASDIQRLPFFSCRGYVSDSECWAAARRLRGHSRAGKQCTILHFGDHDPSGIDMSRDIMDRLTLFGAPDLDVKRMALNMDQVREYSPPPNPAKQTDTRFKDYSEKFGDESWELDALAPDVMVELVKSAVGEFVNPNIWDEDEEKEERFKDSLRLVSERWDDVVQFVNKPKKKK